MGTAVPRAQRLPHLTPSRETFSALLAAETRHERWQCPQEATTRVSHVWRSVETYPFTNFVARHTLEGGAMAALPSSANQSGLNPEASLP